MKNLTTLFAVWLGLATTAAAEEANATQQLGHQCSSDFHHGAAEAMWTRMTPDMQRALGSLSALAQFQQKTTADLGAEVTLISEKTTVQQGFRVYSRVARFSNAPAPFELICAFDQQGHIAGFYIRPSQSSAAVDSAFLNYQTNAELRLPFSGEWFVVWGGRTVEQNYHAVSKDQRFAYDMLKVRDGKSFAGDGSKKEQYFCWDQEILAPGSGTVVVVTDGLPDNEPGQMDAANPAGNHLIIDLGHQEYAVLAHFRRNSIAVKTGEQVVAGQELGRCGNSGNTSEPHLHFHLQNSAKFGQGDGLPAYFNRYLADGKPVTRGEPVRSQTVATTDN